MVRSRVTPIYYWAVFLCLSFNWLGAVQGQQQTALSKENVTISYQTELSAVAHYIALQEGYYDSLNLSVTMKRYPSGMPQVEDAVNNAAWDMGGAGVVPAIIGGSEGILNVGISMDQSATNQLMGNRQGVSSWPPASIDGVPIVVSPNSTGEYVVQACLRAHGFHVDQAKFLYEPKQEKCIEDMTPTNGSEPRANLGGLWAPNTYKFLNSVNGSQTICTGASVYATVTGAHMVRKDFAEQKPKVVARVLAGWLRAVDFINNESNRVAVLDYQATFFSNNGVELPRSSLELDLRLVGLYSLDKQLKYMDRGGNPPISNYDRWTDDVGKFMLENNVVTSVPNTTTYITDQYLKMVKDDPSLRAFATTNREPAEASGAAEDNYYILSLSASVGTAIIMLSFSFGFSISSR